MNSLHYLQEVKGDIQREVATISR